MEMKATTDNTKLSWSPNFDTLINKSQMKVY